MNLSNRIERLERVHKLRGSEDLTPPEEREARSELEADFAAYVRRAWAEADPTDFVEAWHIRAMAEALQAVADGKARNLLILVPPGLAKSLDD